MMQLRLAEENLNQIRSQQGMSVSATACEIKCLHEAASFS